MKTFSKLRELLAGSTPQNWYDKHTFNEHGIHDGVTLIAEIDTGDGFEVFDLIEDPKIKDIEFIAEARNTLPQVLEALDEAVSAIEFVKNDLDVIGITPTEISHLAKLQNAIARIRELGGAK